jgi:hypothetical protein
MSNDSNSSIHSLDSAQERRACDWSPITMWLNDNETDLLKKKRREGRGDLKKLIAGCMFLTWTPEVSVPICFCPCLMFRFELLLVSHYIVAFLLSCCFSTCERAHNAPGWPSRSAGGTCASARLAPAPSPLIHVTTVISFHVILTQCDG